MKIVGLITEYNPFHSGHEYHIQQAKAMTNADYALVVMSGNFVQRGTPAIFDKQIRTEMALVGGADLVIELPVSYATASAETFAFGAVAMLHGLGVDCICFGAETANIKQIMEAAQILSEEPTWYKSTLRTYLSQGYNYPVARAKALPEYDALLSEPNNILGIEYCKALLRLKSGIKPYVLKRSGLGYHDTYKNIRNDICDDVHHNLYSSVSGDSASDNSRNANIISTDFPSATALRQLLQTATLVPGNFAAKNQQYSLSVLRSYYEPELWAILEQVLNERGILSEDDFSSMLLHRLLYSSQEELMNHADMSPDLAARIRNTLNEFASFSQYANTLKTKELTRSRINRALLHLLLEIQPSDFGDPDALYGHIIGFRGDSKDIFSQLKVQSQIPLLSKAADYRKILNQKQQQLFEKTLQSSMLYESVSAIRAGKPIIHEYSKPMIIC